LKKTLTVRVPTSQSDLLMNPTWGEDRIAWADWLKSGPARKSALRVVKDLRGRNQMLQLRFSRKKIGAFGRYEKKIFIEGGGLPLAVEMQSLKAESCRERKSAVLEKVGCTNLPHDLRQRASFWLVELQESHKSTVTSCQKT